MDLISSVLEERHQFRPEATTAIPLTERNYITRIDCLVCLNVTATLAPCPNEDHFGRIIKCSQLATSKRNYFKLNGRQWQWWNYTSYGNPLRIDSLPPRW